MLEFFGGLSFLFGNFGVVFLIFEGAGLLIPSCGRSIGVVDLVPCCLDFWFYRFRLIYNFK